MLCCDVGNLKAKRKLNNTGPVLIPVCAGVTEPTLHCLVGFGTWGTYINTDTVATVMAVSNKVLGESGVST